MLATATILVGIGRSLREGFFMFWETLWPLILGFGISGAVQAFVGRDSMQKRLGDHRPHSVVRASGYGLVSSSCSYAASAMAKSLFVKGADYIAAMVFMFASTNPSSSWSSASPRRSHGLGSLPPKRASSAAS